MKAFGTCLRCYSETEQDFVVDASRAGLARVTRWIVATRSTSTTRHTAGTAPVLYALAPPMTVCPVHTISMRPPATPPLAAAFAALLRPDFSAMERRSRL